MKVIALNGIGNANPGWTRRHRVADILGIPEDQLIEFVYEDLMERSWLNKTLVWAARIVGTYYASPAAGIAANYVQDYVDDILVYFLVPGVHKKILARLAGVLKKHPDAIVIGFSLGSVVAYETIQNYLGLGGQPVLITLGSTLGSPPLEALVKKFLKVPNRERPLVKAWFNFYSPQDLLSGPIKGLGCHEKDQFKIRSTHKIETYLEHTKHQLPHLFS
jgi:hypothetical protein